MSSGQPGSHKTTNVSLAFRLFTRFTMASPVSGLWRGRLNSLKIVGAQLTNKIHFYCEKLNSYEHL